ncbi:MAG: TonB family protein [Bacteroidota bacterium]
MNSYINFFIEANLCLLVLGGFYLLALSKERNFIWRRFYILAIVFLSISVPLLQFESPFSSPVNITVADGLQAMILPEVVITAEGEAVAAQTSSFSRAELIGFVYTAGILIFTTLLIYQLFQIIRFYQLRKKERSIQDSHIIIPTHGQLPTFSFFNLLFFDNTIDLTPEEKTKIIQHESAHIKQWHSADVILIEIVKVVFWINPIIWMLRKSLQNVHEYLADEIILKSSNPAQYSSLLAKMAVKQMTLSLGHHFNKSLILKRIEIMKSPRKKPTVWKWLSTLPLVGLVVFVFSCNDETMNDVAEVMETAKQTDIPVHLTDKVAELKLKYPEAEFVYFETAMDNESKLNEFKNIDPATIALVEVKKDPDIVGVLVNKNGALEKVANATTEGEIFQIVDQPAMPQGGYEIFYEHLKNNMTYPVQARKLGVEGKVYVQFVIDKSGTMTDITVVKGIGAGCDAEAARVVGLPYEWSTPRQSGNPVNQRIILPITFSLSGGSGAEAKKETNTWLEFEKMELGDEKTITGKLVSQDGKPLPGVNVVVQGTAVGTVTNLQGEYKIKAPENSTLVYSFIGLKTTAHQVDSKSVVDLVMLSE